MLSDIVKKHLGFHGKTDDKWWLQASIKHYLETGNVSGSLYQAIVEIIKDFNNIKPEEH